MMTIDSDDDDDDDDGVEGYYIRYNIVSVL